VIEKERKRERPRVEIERDQQKRREAENKTTTGVSRILIKYGERHWQWERNCRDKENRGGGPGVSRARD
jgi:hypothetical protein